MAELPRRRPGCLVAALVVSVPIVAFAMVSVGVVFVRAVDAVVSASDRLEHGKCGERGPFHRPPAAKYFGTPREVCTWGDAPNPGAPYAGRYVDDNQTHERRLGQPVRISGFTVWAIRCGSCRRAVVDGFTGEYVEIDVRMFNRDADARSAGAGQLSVWRAGAGFRDADYVGDRDALPGTAAVRSGERIRGHAWFYVGDGHGDLFLRFTPEADRATGVWQLTHAGAALTPSAGTHS